MKTKIMSVIFFCLFFCFSFSWAETSPYKLAKSVVNENYRDDVLSVFGKGTTTDIHKWYITFKDPTSDTGARVVVILNGKIDKFTPTARKMTDQTRTFDPEKTVVSVHAALKSAGKYAEENHIYYDTTRVLLEPTDDSKAPAWQVELRDDGHSRGFVLVNPIDGAFVRYYANSKTEDKDFDEVESAFLGVGGDLEEFFTGHRTVDR